MSKITSDYFSYPNDKEGPDSTEWELAAHKELRSQGNQIEWILKCDKTTWVLYDIWVALPFSRVLKESEVVTKVDKNKRTVILMNS